MPKKLEYEGICSVCMSAPVCIFRKDAKSPILQCAEFESHPPSRMAIGSLEHKRPGKASSVAPIDGKATTKYKGLCMNCRIAPDCTYPKPVGGVWRCDEYE